MSRLVNPLDLTFVLPMRLKANADAERPPYAWVHGILTRIGWKELDPLDRGATEGDEGFVYAELAYFHPHVRSFLYGGKHPDSDAEVHLYSRTDIKSLFVSYKGWTTRFRTSALYLHHIRPDSLLLSLQIESTEPIPWARALDSVSLIRTVSFQHFENQPRRTEEGAAINVWAGKDEDFLDHLSFEGKSPRSSTIDRDAQMRGAIKFRKPEAVELWDSILKPLRDNGLTTELLGDHRTPMMVFAGVPDPESLTEDEWFALAQADTSEYPTYALPFRDKELQKAAYDRWWDGKRPDHRQRYLVTPLTFISVSEQSADQPLMRSTGVAGPDDFERTRKTWKRQYYQIFLMSHYQRSALLILEQRVSELVVRIRQSKRRIAEAETVALLQGDMAKFSSGHWFPEVTPQVQGQELYGMLRSHLRLSELYRSVVDDKSLLVTWLQARGALARDQQWDKINDKYLPAILLITAMGAGVITEPLRQYFLHWFCNTGLSSELRSLCAGVLVLLSFAPVAWGAWRLARWTGRKDISDEIPSERGHE